LRGAEATDASHGTGLGVAADAHREDSVGAFVIHQREADLLHVVGAARAAGCFPRLLHGRQQQRDQNADDCDNHQKFDERKAQRRTTTNHQVPLSKKWATNKE